MEIWCQIRDKVVHELDYSTSMSDQMLKDIIKIHVNEYARSHMLSINKRQEIERQIFNSFRGLDVLQFLLDDEEVTEIMVNGHKNIFYEKKGALHKWEGSLDSEEKLSDMIQQIVGQANRSVNEANPIVDTRLKDGSRVNVVLSPIAIDGSSMSIRKFTREQMSFEKLIAYGSMSEEVAEFLKLLVVAGYNIIACGGTSSGKTTFLNALAGCIPSDLRVVTIEDSAELHMESVVNIVRLEARSATVNGVEPITIRDLIKNALRMRPDRIVVGEVRGGEALDLLQALNTGHDGSLSTGHANSCRDMISRLETMSLMAMNLPLEAIRRQIASGVDIFVHLGRLRDGSRKLLSICETDGMKDGEVVLNTLYEFREEAGVDGKVHGTWERKNPIKNLSKLSGENLLDLYARWEKGIKG